MSKDNVSKLRQDMNPQDKHSKEVHELHNESSSIFREAIGLITCTVSIYVCYIGYGLLQEEIYDKKFGPNKIYFDHSLFLVLAQCIVNALVGFIVMKYQQAPSNKVPLVDYLKIAASYIGAMFASNAALTYVSYPTQALAKSCKLIPVMLMRIFILRKQYSLKEYSHVFLTTIGIAVFMLFQDAKEKAHIQHENESLGLVLLFISLALDGYTGPRQEKLIEIYHPTEYQMMYWMNLWSVAIVFVALIFTGRIVPALQFCYEYPEINFMILVYSLLSAFGQIAILITVFRFNSLVLTTITTTRKFFTILASVICFGHVLNITQWTGVAMVFLGLGLNIYDKYHEKKKKHHKSKHHGGGEREGGDSVSGKKHESNGTDTNHANSRASLPSSSSNAKSKKKINADERIPNNNNNTKKKKQN